MKFKEISPLPVARTLIGLVLIFNLQAAVYFVFDPAPYAAGFELSGVVGEKAVQGMGILFFMWNVPYVFALLNPVTHRISLISAIIMQAIGFIGESILWMTLPHGHTILESAILRFMVFDSLGLLALIIAWLLTRRSIIDRKNVGISTGD